MKHDICKIIVCFLCSLWICKELFDAGAITEDEYDAKKKQLLGL